MKSSDLKPLSIIAIACLGMVVYSNTFLCSFHFDDTSSIVNNYFIKNFQNLQNIWNYLPRRFILYLSIAFNYHFHQLNVFGYHLFNLLVHLTSAVLVWWLTLLTLSTPAMKENKITRHADLVALFAGLIFVSHPVQTEAVTYIVQRAASMATLFYLASLCLYVKSRLSRDKKPGSGLWKFYYLGSLLATIAAMFTKETAITLPLMILLYEFSFLRSRKSFNWGYVVPFLLTLIIIPIIMLLTETRGARLQYLHSEPGISSMHYFLTQFRVMVTYVRLVFLPFNQNLDYDYPVFKNIFDFPVFFSFLFLTTILLSAKRLFLKYRLVSFSILWFFLTLLPESSFLPIKDVIYEHRLYLPLVGYSLFLVSSTYYLTGKHSFRVVAIALTMMVACYSALTYQRNKVWKNEMTLWEDIVRKSPHKARPYYNRGVVYYQQNDLTQAMSDYNKAIEIDPGSAEAYNSRGVLYDRQGHFTQAIADFDKAIAISPHDAKAYYNRGHAFFSHKNYPQTLLDYNKAIEINPHYAEAYTNRGIFYARQGDFIQAMADFTQAIEMNSNEAKAYYNRGLIYAKQGSFAQAISVYSKAIEIDPKYADAYYNRGLACFKQRDYPQAVSDFTKAIEIDPHQADEYNNRAIAYYQLRKYDEAWADVHQAEKLGAVVNPGLISNLKAVSGRDK